MVYQLSYELRNTEKDYTSFYNFLEREMGQSALHVLRDSWWIHIDSPAELKTLCDNVRAHMGEKDIFFLSELHKDQVNGWMPSSHWKWLNEHQD